MLCHPAPTLSHGQAPAWGGQRLGWHRQRVRGGSGLGGARQGRGPCADTGADREKATGELRAGGAGRAGADRQGAGQADARAGEGPGPSARQHEGAVSHGALTAGGRCAVGTTGQGGRRPHPIGPTDTRDQALPLWLTRFVPAHAPKGPQSLQTGMGPGLASDRDGARACSRQAWPKEQTNNVPMRTSAFYFLPTMFSWQTRQS